MAEEELCLHDLIVQALDQCAYVKQHCAEQSEYINFINFYYCDINQSIPIILLVSIVAILFVFNFLGTTTDTYLAPTLEIMTEKLKLSEAIAGVTLLALANGATDVISGLAAGGKESGGLHIAIGGLFGACLFGVTIVLARCIQGGNEIKVDAAGLQRDVVFLLIATGYFIFLTTQPKVTWPMTLGFFAIYVIFIGYVVYKERVKANKKRKAQNKWAKLRTKFLYQDDDLSDGENGRRKKIEALWDRVLTPYLLKSIVVKRKNHGLKRGLTRTLTASIMMKEDHESAVPAPAIPADKHEIKKHALDADAEDEDKSLYGRIMRIYNIPLYFIRNLTMPPFEKEDWNLWTGSLTPIFGMVFFIWQVGLLDDLNQHWHLWFVVGGIAILGSVLFFCLGRNQNLAETHSGKLATVTFIISTLWLNLIANAFMDLLALITVVSGLPLIYLSLTLLAWGNSLADVFIDYVISKSGHGRMAVIGVYGGQIFNLLIGFGGSLLLQAKKKPVVINLYDFTPEHLKENVLIIVLLGCLIVCLVTTLVIGYFQKWVLNKNMMWYQVFFYFVFFAIVTIMTFI